MTILLSDRVAMLSTLGLTEKICVEVGVFWGNYSRSIFIQKPSKLYLIDLWKHQDFTIYPENSNQTDSQFEQIYNTLTERYAQFDYVKIIRDYSHNAAKLFEPSSIDFVYIDANHSFETVMQDFKIWWPLVKRGGWFCGHDLTNPNVIEVLKIFFGGLDKLDYKTQVDDSRSSSWAKRR